VPVSDLVSTTASLKTVFSTWFLLIPVLSISFLSRQFQGLSFPSSYCAPMEASWSRT
jgi:hypothetical protein